MNDLARAEIDLSRVHLLRLLLLSSEENEQLRERYECERDERIAAQTALREYRDTIYELKVKLAVANRRNAENEGLRYALDYYRGLAQDAGLLPFGDA